MALAYIKEPRIEIPDLLLLIRSQQRPCLLDVRAVCKAPGHVHDIYCVPCHGNSHAFNKGRGMKAHDFFVVQGCARCHLWLDESYVASGEERELAFLTGLSRQVAYWARELANAASMKERNRAAITMALDHLIERGYARRTNSHLYAEPTYAR